MATGTAFAAGSDRNGVARTRAGIRDGRRHGRRMDLRLCRRHHRQYCVPLMKASDRDPLWAVLRQLRRLQRGVDRDLRRPRRVPQCCRGAGSLGVLLRVSSSRSSRSFPGNVAPRVNVDDGGTTFWPDRSIEIPIQIALLGAVTASAVYTIFAPARNGDHPSAARHAVLNSVHVRRARVDRCAAPVAKLPAGQHEVLAPDAGRIRTGRRLAVRVRRLGSSEGRHRRGSRPTDVHIGSSRVRHVRRQCTDDRGRLDDTERQGVTRAGPVLLAAPGITAANSLTAGLSSASSTVGLMQVRSWAKVHATLGSAHQRPTLRAGSMRPLARRERPLNTRNRWRVACKHGRSRQNG